MPFITLKKELKRSYGEFEKVFPEGSEIFVSWDHHNELVKSDHCNEIKIEKQKEIKLKKVKKESKK
jgi:hypothetical protein